MCLLIEPRISSPQAVRVRVNFGDRPFAYGEGHAHRNAADVEEGDTMEEVAANFDALPFAVGTSDSEGEEVDGEAEGGAAGMVVELAQTGPPTKKMKTPIATVGECTCNMNIPPTPLLLIFCPLSCNLAPSSIPSLTLSLPPSSSLTLSLPPFLPSLLLFSLLSQPSSPPNLPPSCSPPSSPPGYDAEASLSYQLVTSYDNMLESGPLVRPGGSGQEEESEEEGSSTPQVWTLNTSL